MSFRHKLAGMLFFNSEILPFRLVGFTSEVIWFVDTGVHKTEE